MGPVGTSRWGPQQGRAAGEREGGGSRGWSSRHRHPEPSPPELLHHPRYRPPRLPFPPRRRPWRWASSSPATSSPRPCPRSPPCLLLLSCPFTPACLPWWPVVGTMTTRGPPSPAPHLPRSRSSSASRPSWTTGRRRPAHRLLHLHPWGCSQRRRPSPCPSRSRPWPTSRPTGRHHPCPVATVAATAAAVREGAAGREAPLARRPEALQARGGGTDR